jgi:hypothetical protein
MSTNGTQGLVPGSKVWVKDVEEVWVPGEVVREGAVLAHFKGSEN